MYLILLVEQGGVFGCWCNSSLVDFMIVGFLCLLPGKVLLSLPVLLLHPLEVGLVDVECVQSGGVVGLFTGVGVVVV